MHVLSRWWTPLVLVAALPLLLAVGTYQAALLVPGTVPVFTWKSFISWAFLAAAVVTLLFAWRARGSWRLRAGFAVVLVPLLLAGWFVFGVRSTCYEGPTHIGSKPKVGVASCR